MSRIQIGWSIEEAVNPKLRKLRHSDICEGFVYKITNIKNNKTYVGLTTQDLSTRFKQHIKNAIVYKRNTKLCVAIRKYGAESFIIESIYTTNSREKLQEKEVYYINKLNCIAKGYNSSKGGVLGYINRPVTVQNKTFTSTKELCKHYNIKITTYHQRRHQGWSLEQALGIESRRTKALCLGNEVLSYNSIADLCEETGIDKRAVKSFSFKYSISQEEAYIKAFYEKNHATKPIRILSWDAGTKNAALSIVDYQKDKAPRLVISLMTTDLVTSMGETLDKQTGLFIKFFTKIIDTYKPDIISPELFMQRSFRSNLASMISYMIGILSEIAYTRNIHFSPIMPSTWKRQIERDLIKVDELYDRSYPVKERLPDHIIDSIFIGAYHNPQGYKRQGLDKWKELIQQVQNSTSIQNWLEQEKQRKKSKPKTTKKKRKSRKKK